MIGVQVSVKLAFVWLATIRLLVACDCFSPGSACSAMSGDAVVFVGRVLVDSGEGWGTRPARLHVEEPLLNVPQGVTEVEVHAAHGTDCYYRLRDGERYVIFAHTEGPSSTKLRTGACSNNFLVRGHEHILDALRNKSKGGSPRIVGTVLASTDEYSHEGAVAGAQVVAESDTRRYEARTNSSGVYELQGVSPGRYTFSVIREGFVADSTYNERWNGRLVANAATRRIEPDASGHGAVFLAEHSCEVWDLGMWPDGQISGIVRSSEDKPLEGVEVQAYQFDRKGERKSRPLVTTISGQDGGYTLKPLPSGDYIVGVNAKSYFDESPYPPTVYTAEGDSAIPSTVRLAESERRLGVDLVLPPKREAIRLRVLVNGPEGRPERGAYVILENLKGVQRWYSNETTNRDGWIDVPAFVGEEYVVKASSSWVRRASRTGFEQLRGKITISPSKQHNSVSIVLSKEGSVK